MDNNLDPLQRLLLAWMQEGERTFWVALRRHLISVVRLIERRYNLGDHK